MNLATSGRWSHKCFKTGKFLFYSRNDNCVKNHFFSRLRKGLRKLNKIIVQEYKKTIKEIKNIVLYKIIEVT